MDKKKCFVITPIGNDTDPIRRHIDGIIDAAIVPSLGDDYEISVSHRIFEPGTLTKQIIAEIFNADLVITNLTEKNPNVMYELAFRHCLGTPAIIIAEKGTQLPADITAERTIFYHNDAKGVLELKETLKSFISEIDPTEKVSPILDALKDLVSSKKILDSADFNSIDSDAFQYILRKLNEIDTKVDRFKPKSNLKQGDISNSEMIRLKFPFINRPSESIGTLDDIIEEYIYNNFLFNRLVVKHGTNSVIIKISGLRASGPIITVYKEIASQLVKLGYELPNDILFNEQEMNQYINV